MKTPREAALKNAFIAGTGHHVPARVVTNNDLVQKFGIDTTNEWIVQRTGIEERRYADEGVNTSDLALIASHEALARAGLKPADLDLIIFATLSPDHVFPGAGVYLQRKLGLLDGDSPKFVPALDIRNQCSGFVYGLATASSFVRSGGAQHVLLVGAELHSAALDFSTRGRQVASLFGDGAGAVVISATDEDRGIRGWYLGADGRFADNLSQRIWDVRRRPFIPLNAEGTGQIEPDFLWAHMDGKVVFKHAIEKMILVLMQACWDQKIDVSDIDLFLFHQANLRINEYVAQQLSLPREKVFQNIQKYGNTTAATIPILMSEAEREGRLKRGMKVATVAFGSGFTWGASIIDW
jgi:3-oxoacyl-[acyl-carrier-protein] synthase-3